MSGKKFVFWGLISIIQISAIAQKTEIKYLSGTDKDNTVTWDFFCTHGMNSGKWSAIEVPSQWEQQGFGSYNYGNVDLEANEKGFYKYEFEVPTTWEKKEIYIVFEGSMTDTEVKVNGMPAGPIHQGAFYQFRYNITKLLNMDGNNLLEVNVSKESTNESVNNAERKADYWVFGGIFRPVYLEAFPNEFIDRVAIDAKADGSFYMDVFLNGPKKAKTVEAQIQTMEGKPFGEVLSTKISKGFEEVQLQGVFKDPSLWDPEFPNLYQVVVSLRDNSKVIHQVTQKFGFRTVELKQGDGIYVNGTKVMFRGVCRHTFWPGSGRASSKQLAINDVNTIKDMNMNAVRMSHYPPDQFFLDVCDSLGLFVLDELAGWQGYYDTPTASRLVKQLVDRDVNHPSIVIWANGNEGGFNKDVRLHYALYDHQNRPVIEPWAKLNGMDTKHYPKYKYVEGALKKGDHIYFPTEFLHGLYDGGHGAGLEDYWDLMLSSPLSAGGFLWVYADEGIERRDLNDSIDTKWNLAPDGILGPYGEKEGSFYTIKDIWSPVQFKDTGLSSGFTGNFEVVNRFLYTNINQCKFSYELVKFERVFPEQKISRHTGTIEAPDVGPNESGPLKINLPENAETYDVLYISAFDRYNRLINTWSWNISSPSSMAKKTVSENNEHVYAATMDSVLIVSSGKTSVAFNKKTGLLSQVKNNEKVISFNSGPLFTGFEASFKEMKHYQENKNYVVEIVYHENCHVKWTMLPGGWLQFDYDYNPSGLLDFTGITFSYPEGRVTGATLLANGPYHVWKNRLKGNQFGLFTKPYNNTITGQTWDYPEFKGYYSNFYAVEIQTTELPFTIVSATNDLFLHLFTPQKPDHAMGGVNPPFPAGNISVLHGISAIGTKFSQAEEEGPQGKKNDYGDGSEVLQGRLFFRFGK